MDATDFLTLLPIFACAFFLVVGERLKDNIYRSLAGVLALTSALIPGFPVAMIPIVAIFAVYALLMWRFQSSIRPTQEYKEE